MLLQALKHATHDYDKVLKLCFRIIVEEGDAESVNEHDQEEK